MSCICYPKPVTRLSELAAAIRFEIETGDSCRLAFQTRKREIERYHSKVLFMDPIGGKVVPLQAPNVSHLEGLPVPAGRMYNRCGQEPIFRFAKERDR